MAFASVPTWRNLRAAAEALQRHREAFATQSVALFCIRRHGFDRTISEQINLSLRSLGMANRSRYLDGGSATALAIYLGVYLGLAGCFGAGFYWLMLPRVFANPGLAAYKPPPKTVVITAGLPDPRVLPPAPEPTPVAIATPAPLIAGSIAGSSAIAQKKEAKKPSAVTIQRARRPRPERSNPMRDYAYQPYSFRPLF
jgi:hypothetical protein